MSSRGQSQRGLWAGAVLLGTLLLALDAITPLWINMGVAYVALALLGLWSPCRSLTYSLALAGTCLVVLGLLVSPQDGVALSAAVCNRSLAVAAIWAITLVSIRWRKKASREARSDLDNEKAMGQSDQLQLTEAALKQKTDELASTRDVAVYALAKVAETRDLETGQHLERIRAFSHILALELRRSPAFAQVIDDEFLESLYRSSPLHDIGKVGIRDEILLKPGRFTPEEFELMKRHTTIGTNLLQDAVSHNDQAEFLQMAALIARCHHERFDGSGYPAGLSGAAIPLPARIVAVADVFDALTTERPYKEAYSLKAARQIIVEEAGRHFDPAVVEAFENRFDDFVKVQLRYPNKYVQIFGLTESLLAEVCAV